MESRKGTTATNYKTRDVKIVMMRVKEDMSDDEKEHNNNVNMRYGGVSGREAYEANSQMEFMEEFDAFY